MTSSLVGSEMCIRDRESSAWRSFEVLLGSRRTRLRMLNTTQAIGSGMTVSYTHLTLPTICSV
eukprot:3647786-Prorocentrum_lima.AAC.1